MFRLFKLRFNRFVFTLRRRFANVFCFIAYRFVKYGAHPKFDTFVRNYIWP